MTNEQPNLALNAPEMPGEYFDDSTLFNEDGTIKEAPQSIDENIQGSNQDIIPQVVDDSADFIKIPRKELQQYIDKLRVEDKEFAQVYNRDIGFKAAQRYKPEIDTLRKQNEALLIAVKRAEYVGMSQEQINEKFKSDADFAREYTEVMHTAPQPIIQAQVNPIEVKSALDSVLSFAEGMLTPEQLTEVKNKLSAGDYDKDETGNFYESYAWREGIANIRQDITRYIRSTQVNSNNNQPVTQPVQPQIRQDTANPDMSNGGNRGIARQTRTMAQVLALPWEEQFRLYPNEGDLERAVERGEIVTEL